MTGPVFLSSRWTEDAPRPQVDVLDRQLRLRGVPVWRDVRGLGAGGVNEDVAAQALTEQCCGAVLYFSDDLFDSWFIKSVELKAIHARLQRDSDFFLAAVFDGVDGDAIERLQRESGVDAKAFHGLFLQRESEAIDQLRPFAHQILDRYLSLSDGPVAATAATRDVIRIDDEALLHLNWKGLLGDDAASPAPEAAGELKSAISDVRAALERRFGVGELTLGGRMHLSAAFLIGWQFREPTGWTVLCQHERAPTRTELVAADEQGWNLNLRSSQNDSEILVVKVAVSQDPSGAVLAYRESADPARAELVVLPPEGTPSKTALAETDSNALAAAIVAEIQQARARFGVSRSDLYFACPWTFALQLGWMFGSLGHAAIFEAVADKSTYYDDAIVLP